MTIEATHELPHINNLFAIAVRGESVAGMAATLQLGMSPFYLPCKKYFFLSDCKYFFMLAVIFCPLKNYHPMQ